MLCPYCNKEIHYQSKDSMIINHPDEFDYGSEISSGFCPSCNKEIIFHQEGPIKNFLGTPCMDSFFEKQLIYPINKNLKEKSLPKEVPVKYQSDYNEALITLHTSPKASAALCRRCLQMFFHEELSINKKNLKEEIEYFIENSNAPSYLIDAVDAIRNIGNFAAHPMKYTTGEIVDVEPGEAEWLIDVIYSLFDFYFVQPQRLKERKDALNEKLQSLGKPLMK